jgi:hypothetical protein
MEGTRLTIVKVPSQPDAYEFSIRTPVTPPRWKDFDQVPCACQPTFLIIFTFASLPFLDALLLLPHCTFLMRSALA